MNTQAVVDLTQSLGWIINKKKKSELKPSQVFSFVGYKYHLDSALVKPTQERWLKLQDLILLLKSKRVLTARCLMSLIGLLASMEKMVLEKKIRTETFSGVLVRGLQVPSRFSPCKTHSREMAQTPGFDPTPQVKTCFDCKMFDVANWVASLNGKNGPGKKKSELKPSQVFSFVGYKYHLDSALVKPTQERWLKLQDLILLLKSKRVLTARCLMSLIGLLASMEKMVLEGRLHMRPFQFHLKEHWRYPQSLDNLLPVMTLIVRWLFIDKKKKNNVQLLTL